MKITFICLLVAQLNIGKALADDSLSDTAKKMYSKSNRKVERSVYKSISNPFQIEFLEWSFESMSESDHSKVKTKDFEKVVKTIKNPEQVKFLQQCSNGDINIFKNSFYKKAKNISSEKDRISALEKEGVLKPKVPEIVKVSPGLTFQPDQTVETSKGTKYKVIKYLTSGRRGAVYLVRPIGSDPSSKPLILKIAKNSLPDTLKSLKEESSKVEGLQKVGVKHATIVEAGDTYAVKEYIEGPTAAEWLAQWEKGGFKRDAPQIVELRRLLISAAEKGGYVGDLNPKNLIWVGKNWVVIDSGSVSFSYKKKEILIRYEEKIAQRWGKALSDAGRGLGCTRLLGGLIQVSGAL